MTGARDTLKPLECLYLLYFLDSTDNVFYIYLQAKYYQYDDEQPPRLMTTLASQQG